ncbi:hypothetical protein ACH5RR_032592 [Cinchona calisaya]|uniref:Uncharacterized protein n=1 Tax=Cinchona calisaya TaxID=153742 RepID=A0ABD2YM17_9GENT
MKGGRWDNGIGRKELAKEGKVAGRRGWENVSDRLLGKEKVKVNKSGKKEVAVDEVKKQTVGKDQDIAKSNEGSGKSIQNPSQVTVSLVEVVPLVELDVEKELTAAIPPPVTEKMVVVRPQAQEELANDQFSINNQVLTTQEKDLNFEDSNNIEDSI